MASRRTIARFFLLLFLVGLVPISHIIGEPIHFGPSEYSNLFILYSVVGVVANLLCRESELKGSRRNRSLGIVLEDDGLQKVTVFSLISFVYTFAKGALMGVAFALIQLFAANPLLYASCSLRRVFMYGFDQVQGYSPNHDSFTEICTLPDSPLIPVFLIMAMIPVAMLVFIRIVSESLVLLLRAAQGLSAASKYFTDKSKATSLRENQD